MFTYLTIWKLSKVLIKVSDLQKNAFFLKPRKDITKSCGFLFCKLTILFKSSHIAINVCCCLFTGLSCYSNMSLRSMLLSPQGEQILLYQIPGCAFPCSYMVKLACEVWLKIAEFKPRDNDWLILSCAAGNFVTEMI